MKRKTKKAIDSHDPGSDAGWAFLEVLGYGVGVANLPLGIALVVGASLADTITHNRKRSKTPMPDDWLKEVSESSDVSEKGLSYLAKALKKKGYVSVADAVTWAQIEKVETEKVKAKAERENSLAASGAQALMARASSQCVDFLDAGAALNAVRGSLQNTSSFAKGLFGRNEESQ